MRSRLFITVLALSASIEAYAATPQVDQFTREIPVAADGMVWLDNPYGSIDVTGTDDDKISITVQRQITAMDDESLVAAREKVIITFEGDPRVRVIKTRYPEPRDPRWVALCNYFVRVPRGVNVKIGGRAMDHIRLSQLAGNVTVSAFSGTIILSNVTGPSTIDTVNGRVIYDYTQRPTANANVQGINTDIDIYAPRESAFEWVAQSLNGDLLTSFLDIHGLFHGMVFRGRENGNAGAVPTITTSTVSGRVMFLARGTSPTEARRIVAATPPVRPNEGRTEGRSMAVVSPQPQPVPQGVDPNGNLQTIKKFQVPIIYMQNWQFVSNVMDVAVGEVHGNARVVTGAGEVELGVVFGTCQVDSGGGPLNLGDLLGPIDVHTDAGDVVIRAARQGGSASTDGGILRVAYAGGPLSLRSGGGDIIVQQTAAPIDAATRSGDVSITVSPQMKTDHIIGKTSQGNVTLIVSPNFAADIDATLLTDDPDNNRIRSDFNLNVSREPANGKTRLHATGKINGGGERIELSAVDGSIVISSQVVAATTLPRR